MSSRVPPEIWDQIIGHVDAKSLPSVSLVCHGLMRSSRRYMFREIVLMPEKQAEFFSLLSSPLNTLTLVPMRKLTAMDYARKDLNWFGRNANLLSPLSFTTLRLMTIYFPIDIPEPIHSRLIEFHLIVQGLQEPLRKHGTIKTLNSLLSKSPSLKTFRLERVLWEEAVPGPSEDIPTALPTLELLTIAGCRLWPLTELIALYKPRQLCVLEIWSPDNNHVPLNRTFHDMGSTLRRLTLHWGSSAAGEIQVDFLDLSSNNELRYLSLFPTFKGFQGLANFLSVNRGPGLLPQLEEFSFPIGDTFVYQAMHPWSEIDEHLAGMMLDKKLKKVVFFVIAPYLDAYNRAVPLVKSRFPILTRSGKMQTVWSEMVDLVTLRRAGAFDGYYRHQ